MKGLTIGIVTQSHLCRNPRVLKEAIAAASAGYEVIILNTVVSQALYREDLSAVSDHPHIRISPVADLTQSGLRSFTDRVVLKLGMFFVSRLKVQSFLALGYGALRYFSCCKGIRADLYICHQELATYTGSRLLKAGFKVAFDLEDWYSEDLLPGARATRPVNLLRTAECKALRQGVFCMTTSYAMAKELAKRYDSAVPAVIYNIFPRNSESAPKKSAFTTPLKLFWFSQTIGPGRGIEEFIRLSSSFRQGYELHLLGNVDEYFREQLTALMTGVHRLFFHPLVTERELPDRIRDFDIGLALELTEPLSRNYTITNKFFQYLEAGLPVIATATAGQREVFEQFKAGFMLPTAPGPIDLEDLEIWLNNPSTLRKAQFTAHQASAFYTWDSQMKTMLTLIQGAIG
ncbi:glycosyltransferase family 4 protein [Mucilaginibacter corticis]|uniref:Glycosyltransferase family 4 protein n=1 Tax=Mucilaginibacter corticis TaxID=2597670 RepID=A0A556M865_9SPHI|nr:glycosyltransferase family 4 protein [Mucilaginibacter corticis]TSJ35975.1 glycosyltransferase family 4 protein [Mucilaginibacter corticis]